MSNVINFKVKDSNTLKIEEVNLRVMEYLKKEGIDSKITDFDDVMIAWVNKPHVKINNFICVKNGINGDYCFFNSYTIRSSFIEVNSKSLFCNTPDCTVEMFKDWCKEKGVSDELTSDEETELLKDGQWKDLYLRADLFQFLEIISHKIRYNASSTILQQACTAILAMCELRNIIVEDWNNYNAIKSENIIREIGGRKFFETLNHYRKIQIIASKVKPEED